MRQKFNVAKAQKVRLWNRYMMTMYEEISKPNASIQDAGLYSGQVVVLELQNEDGTWPRGSDDSETKR